MAKKTTKKRSRPAARKKKTASKTSRARPTTRRQAKSARGTPLEQPLDLVTGLMSIPGKSCEESQVADFIVDRLIATGAKRESIKFDNSHQKTPIQGQVGNLILQIPGSQRGPRRLLMAHMDTVPICVGSQPKRQGKFVRSADPATGLGADNRAGCAVILHAAQRLLRERPDHPPLTFLWTIQEEIGLHGARHVRMGMLGKPALAFNWDGGNPAKLTIGATGGYRIQIDVHGIASHAGNAPEHGVSAISIASLAIASLQADGWHGLVNKRGKRGSTNIGVIRGGNATNVVTDHVALRAEARSHDPQFRKRIVQQIEAAFRRAAKQVKSVSGKTGKVSFQGQLDYESFQLDTEEPNVVAAMAAVKAVGKKPIASISNGGVDANWMTARGIPTVTLGCGQTNPHTVKEALNIAEYDTACKIAWRLATGTE